jgi:hypothetical protein
MDLRHIGSRIQRLETLILGLSKETIYFKNCDSPLLHMERQAYLDGLLDACAGLESARLALVRAKTRLERQR